MAVVPSGSPAWTRTVSFTDYGGHTEKQNHQSQGVVNPRTDVGAEDWVRSASDLAASVRTLPLITITYLQDDTGTANPTVECVRMMTQVYEVSYPGGSPPSGLPTVERTGDGVCTITLASSYSDEYGVSGAFTPRQAKVTVEGSAFGKGTYSINGSVVTVYTWDAAGSAETDRRVTVSIY